jgi:mono/diheme cytochrome c family protein
MRALKIFCALVALIVFLLAAVAVREIRVGFSARTEPSSIEKLVAKTARKMAVPSSYQKLQNPFAASSENLRAGMEHFADHCATCHANDGSGDTLFGRGLYPKPPDMRGTETQNKSDGELYYTIENGVRLSGMPAFGEAHGAGGDADNWRLVLFIRHIPTLTAAEIRQMEELNPKTEEERREEKDEKEFLQGADQRPQNSKSQHH